MTMRTEDRIVRDPDHHTDADPAVRNPTEARQGREGRPVRNVLWTSLGLVVVAFVVIYLVFY